MKQTHAAETLAQAVSWWLLERQERILSRLPKWANLDYVGLEVTENPEWKRRLWKASFVAPLDAQPDAIHAKAGFVVSKMFMDVWQPDVKMTKGESGWLVSVTWWA